MKTNNLKSEPELSDYNKMIGTIQAKNDGKNSLLINLLPVLSMLSAIVPSLFIKSSGLSIAKLAVLTLILSGAAVYYIYLNSENLLAQKSSKYIIVFSYLSSIFLSILITKPDLFCFWMIGGLLVAMLIDMKLGLFFHFNISLILGIFLGLRPETIIQLLIIGLLLCVLSGSLKQKSTVIYAAIIILSANITLSFVIHNFVINSKTNQNYISLFFSLLSVLIITYLIYESFARKSEVVQDELLNQLTSYKLELAVSNTDFLGVKAEDKVSIQTISSDQSVDINNSLNDNEEDGYETLSGNFKSLRTSYELLNDDNNILLQKMKQYSESLYQHALQIGDLSCRAAKVIDANENLAKAGGLYHDVGKIAGKNYIEEGLKIAEDFSFPKELKDILKQHNIKYEKPTSVEAAIVMLSDSVLSTMKYIANSGELKFTSEKIIENLFRMRMEKGSLDNSGLSLKDYNLLKNFYQQEFASKNQDEIFNY